MELVLDVLTVLTAAEVIKETYCNQCKKTLSVGRFDMKNEQDYYTRCRNCRASHNENNKKSYNPIKKKFSDYDGETPSGKKKVDCWSDKNAEKPSDVAFCGNRKFWFDCDTCAHEFDGSLSNIARGGHWCPYCSIPVRKMCGREDCHHCYLNSFASFPDKTSSGKKKVDCWSDKNAKKPQNVATQCNRKFKFDCDVCSHEFDSSLNKVVGYGRWCRFCANQDRCEKEDCDHCYLNSFASYDDTTPLGKKKVDCWSDKNTKKPRDVAMKCGRKFKFDCDVCSHEFDSSLNSVTKGGSWCRFCANQDRCEKEDCDHCYLNSFASYDGTTPLGKKKVDCWSDKNTKKPRNVAMKCGRKFKFDCDVCSHEFDSSLNSVTKGGPWCRFCANQDRCEKEDCDHCYLNSFASYDGTTPLGKKKVDCWSDKNAKKPRNVARHGNIKFKFDCDVCSHEFDSSLNKVTGYGQWCPHCKNKTELKLYDWLCERSYIKKVKREFAPKWFAPYYHIVKDEIKEDVYRYRFDFLLTFKNGKNLIIELDGQQHYVHVPFFQRTLLEIQLADEYKRRKAEQKGIPVKRVRQVDVWHDRNHWEDKLINLLRQYQ